MGCVEGADVRVPPSAAPTIREVTVADWFDRDGRPMNDVREWGRVYEAACQDGTRHVAETELVDVDGTTVRVSTVWLGINHNWHPAGPPLIFETMIFGGRLDLEQWRYPTEVAALAGHDQAAAAVRAGERLDG